MRLRFSGRPRWATPGARVTGGLSPPMRGQTPRWRNPRRNGGENLALFARRRPCTRDVWGFGVRVGLWVGQTHSGALKRLLRGQDFGSRPECQWRRLLHFAPSVPGGRRVRGPPLVVALRAGKAVRAANAAKTGHRPMLVSCVAWPLEQFRGSPEHPGREVPSNPSRQAILCAGGSAHHGSGPPAPKLPPGASSAPSCSARRSCASHTALGRRGGCGSFPPYIRGSE